MAPNGLQRFVIYDLAWSAYVGVLDAMGKHRLRHVYHDTTLELTTRRLRENRIAKITERIIGTLSLEVDMAIMSAGSVTIMRAGLNCGIEPDSSFYVSSEPHVRRGIDLPLAEMPPPNLVIEVDPYTDCLISRLNVFALLGVREVWQCGSTGDLEFYRLQGRNRYRRVSASKELPVSPEALSRAVRRMNDVSENSLVRQVVRELIHSS